MLVNAKLWYEVSCNGIGHCFEINESVRHAMPMRQLGGIWVLIHYRAVGIKLS